MIQEVSNKKKSNQQIENYLIVVNNGASLKQFFCVLEFIIQENIKMYFKDFQEFLSQNLQILIFYQYNQLPNDAMVTLHGHQEFHVWSLFGTVMFQIIIKISSLTSMVLVLLQVNQYHSCGQPVCIPQYHKCICVWKIPLSIGTKQL